MHKDPVTGLELRRPTSDPNFNRYLDEIHPDLSPYTPTPRWLRTWWGSLLVIPLVFGLGFVLAVVFLQLFPALVIWLPKVGVPALIIIAMIVRTIVVLRDPDLKRWRPGPWRDWAIDSFVGLPLLIMVPIIGGIIAILLWLIYAPLIAQLFPNGW